MSTRNCQDCADLTSDLFESRLGWSKANAEIARLKAALAEEWARTDALVASLPACDRHPDRPATRAWKRGGSRYCDECGAGYKWAPAPDYPRAEPLRAIVAARAEKK